MRMALPRTICSITSSSSSFICFSATWRVRGRVEALQAVRVVEEAAVDVVTEQLAGRHRHLVGHATPAPVLLPHHVGPLEDVRDPADLTLGVCDLEIGEAG